MIVPSTSTSTDARRPWPRSVKATLALALALVCGFSGWSTFAYWSDQAVVTTGTFTAGTLDLRIDGTNAAGPGENYTKGSIAATGILPGESFAYPLTITNTGNPPVTYTMTVTRASGWTYVAGNDALRIRVFSGGTPATTSGYPRTGTCNGSTALGAITSVAASSSDLILARPLSADASEALCVVVSMPIGLESVNQGRTGAVALTVTATQATT